MLTDYIELRMKPVLIPLLFFQLSLFTIACSLEIYIDQDKGNDSQVCLHSNVSNSNPCSSIEYVSKELDFALNLTIYVNSESINLTEMVAFKNMSQLSVLGKPVRKPTIICSHSNAHGEHGTGFLFSHIDSLQVSSLDFIGCGGQQGVYKTALAVVNCTDVLFASVDISESKRTSLVIINTYGNVSFHNVTVRNTSSDSNTVQGGKSFAGGIHIHWDRFYSLTNSSPSLSHYFFVNCIFYNITTTGYSEFDPSNVTDVYNWLGYEQGGGLALIFGGNAHVHTNVVLRNCTFQNNTAQWGAGLYIKFQENSTGNSVSITGSNFSYGNGSVAGGGVMIGQARWYSKAKPNTVSFMDTKFVGNWAKFGAGTYLYAYHSNIPLEEGDYVSFRKCLWKNNFASYSPAVDISPHRFDQLNSGLLPVPFFRDCTFSHNWIKFGNTKGTVHTSSGGFVVTKFAIRVGGELTFENNSYTALLVSSGRIIFEVGTQVIFKSNHGIRGGAIAMYGFSSLLINNGCAFKFINNSAEEFGGAISYMSYEKREFLEGRVCFLEYNGDKKVPIAERNISFKFESNFATITGSSIYATSFFSCFFNYRSSLKGHHVEEFLESIGNFSFVKDDKMIPDLGTAGARFSSRSNQSKLFTIPGKKLILPVSVKDELRRTLDTGFYIRVTNGGNVSLDSLYTTKESTRVFGPQNQTATLVIATRTSFRNIEYYFDVQLLPCPPGYYYDDQHHSCNCSADHTSRAYPGILKCNTHNFTAYIKGGYWAGYHSAHPHLFTSLCPLQFCVLNSVANKRHVLPNSSQELNLVMCGRTRHGVLCGQCQQGFSTYYHSKYFSCGTEESCSYGLLLYIISELLPVFIFFTVVIMFDISFSSGGRNGFVFFSQIVTLLPVDYITYSKTVKLSKAVQYFQIGYNMLYGIFNFEFFTVEQLSFCLFKQAKVMDVLAFKYITTVFAFILVLCLVRLMGCSCSYKVCKLAKKKVTTKVTVLHGLSAFLIICYTESVRVSLFILRRKTLEGEGGVNGPTVAFFGGINHLEEEHIRYALPAIIALGTICLLPPVLLLLYPSLLKLLHLCNASEKRIVLTILRVTRINSLMPLFDVLQGCFKDHLRFFSGLYFVYRAAILMPYSFSQNIFAFTIVSEVLLLLMLGIHSIAQPYKLRRHNIIDSLLFLNLALINGLTIFAIQSLQNDAIDTTGLNLMVFFQILLVYLPLIVIVASLIFKLCKKARKKVLCFQRKEQDKLSNDNFIKHLDETDRDQEDSVLYNLDDTPYNELKTY